MKRITSILFFLLPLLITAQKPYVLIFKQDDSLSYFEEKTPSFSSKDELIQNLRKIQNKKIKKGYVLASIDQIEWQNDTAFVKMYLGEQFQRIHITFDDENRHILRRTPRINERLIAQLPFEPEMVETLLNSIHDYLSNTGYPFAKVYLKIDKIQPDISSAHLHIEKGNLVRIQKIHIRGETKIKEKYIQNAISIKEGDYYSSKEIQRISQRIEQIQFINEIRSYEILFTPEGAEIYLYLESAPVSSINGIVGIQPNPITQKTSLTGDIRLKLKNIVNQGESLEMNWKSVQPKTQELKIDFDFPFLFNTPFGIEAKFHLFKLDSTYLRTNFHLGVRYYFTGGSYLKAFYQANNSNLLYGATSLSLSGGNFATVRTHNYGLGFYRQYVDYLPNPSTGFNIQADITIGKRNSILPESDSTSTTTTGRANLRLEYFFPITRRNVIRLANYTTSYYAPVIYQNELSRFGGLTTQRGFNEETLLATTLSTFTLEYRFLVDRNSHAFAFYDQSIYEKNDGNYVRDTPFGFGVGYSFGTRLGIFSISYALGKQFDNPIQIRDGKVHFGYTAYF